MEKTSPNWTAWKVVYNPPCEPEETLGYYQKKVDAELAKSNFIFSKELKEDGICCGNSKYVIVEEITILS